jgi:hypothetical protein
MRNALGRELEPYEAELAEIYRKLVQLVEEPQCDMPPFVVRNALKAIVPLWQIVNGFDMNPGYLYHVGL